MPSSSLQNQKHFHYIPKSQRNHLQQQFQSQNNNSTIIQQQQLDQINIIDQNQLRIEFQRQCQDGNKGQKKQCGGACMCKCFVRLIVFLILIFVFIGGVVFGEDIKNQYNQWREQEDSKIIEEKENGMMKKDVSIISEIKELTIDQQLSINQSKNIEQNKQARIQQPKQNIQQSSQQQKVPKPLKIRQKFRQKTPKIDPSTDLYDFTVPIEQLIETSPLSYTFPFQYSQWQQISKRQYLLAIKLMYVTHNINSNSQFQFDNYRLYESYGKKYQILNSILKQQESYYQQKYEISKYIHEQIRFCVIVPSYNNAQKTRLYLRNLDSIFQQEYQNYKVIYINDASTDGTGKYVQDYMEVNKIDKEKYVIINNQKKMGGGYNIYVAANQYCELGDVMLLIDGDDALIGRQVFGLLNAIYQKEKVALTYGQFLILQKDKIVRNGPTVDISGNIQQGRYPRVLRRFMTGHLKTMYVDVYRQIKKQDLTYADGRFIEYSTDLAIMTPALEIVGNRSRYTGQVIYQRRLGTGLNQPTSEQDKVAIYIFQKPAYPTLANFTFADNPKTIHFE